MNLRALIGRRAALLRFQAGEAIALKLTAKYAPMSFRSETAAARF